VCGARGESSRQISRKGLRHLRLEPDETSLVIGTAQPNGTGTSTGSGTGAGPALLNSHAKPGTSERRRERHRTIEPCGSFIRGRHSLGSVAPPSTVGHAAAAAAAAAALRRRHRHTRSELAVRRDSRSELAALPGSELRRDLAVRDDSGSELRRDLAVRVIS
jgi:hypothetical protein